MFVSMYPVGVKIHANKTAPHAAFSVKDIGYFGGPETIDARWTIAAFATGTVRPTSARQIAYIVDNLVKTLVNLQINMQVHRKCSTKYDTPTQT